MKYILKRIGMAVVTLFVVTIIVFFMFQIIPGDVATSKLGTDATPERVEALREQYGLNNPVYIQYFNWVKGILSGDMGISYSKDMPVEALVGNNLIVTLSLAVISLIIIVLSINTIFMIIIMKHLITVIKFYNAFITLIKQDLYA